MADTPAGSAVNPPGIGEALGAGWTAFKGNMGIMIGVTLVMVVAGIIPFLPLLLLPGWYSISLKAVRGQKAEFGELFLMFTDRFVDHLMLLLLQICGVIACGIGQLVTQPLFIPGSFLVLDRKMAWKAAMDECMKRVKPNLLNWIIFVIVVMIVGALGTIACIVGVLITAPMAMCAIAYGYEKAFGGGAAKA
ncbi:MAG TPA: hypothetical protein VGK61_02165 [Planctomycetota bacterium]|jgi:hypothetical protein